MCKSISVQKNIELLIWVSRDILIFFYFHINGVEEPNFFKTLAQTGHCIMEHPFCINPKQLSEQTIIFNVFPLRKSAQFVH